MCSLILWSKTLFGDYYESFIDILDHIVLHKYCQHMGIFKAISTSAHSKPGIHSNTRYFWICDGTFRNIWDLIHITQLTASRYMGPTQAARAVGEYFATNRENVRILDVAAGTGKVGQELYNLGFRNLDALDPSEGMLKKAKERGVYTQTFHLFFELNLPIPDDSYECLVVVGAMCEGHLPAESLYKMIRLVKPGGLICIVMKEEYLQYVEAYKDKLQPLMEHLETERKWYQYKKENIPNYAFGKDGIVFQYVVL